MATSNLLTQTRDRYADALARGEANVAQSIIDDAIERGATPPEIYLSVLAPAQVIIGEMWHRGDISIAQEHLATAITMQMMDRQRQAAKPRTPIGLRALVTPAKGDQHFVGARITADLLIMDGWDVDFFWNATPDKDLAEYLQLRRIDLLAISATMSEFLPNVPATTEAIRKLDPSRPKILLGGSAISHTDFDPHELGVDAVVNDVAQAAQIARRLVGRIDTKPSLDQQLAAIGQNIRTARNHRKLTQQQLADASDLDRTYISLVEHGKQNLTIAAILKIAQALDIPITDLINP
ncbi:MAG: helix-turn-helix domain-containing protein [Chloroflexi bacterium]|nr:helix-turn-helix domain-containing protein [Chloroflexota bacterium]MYK61519.1 helix-turn-helix domain-containing protein [Chloroflexota bacterium]